MPLAVVLVALTAAVALIDVAAVMVGAEAARLVALAFLHRQSDQVRRQHYALVLFALFGFGVLVTPAVVSLGIFVGRVLVLFVAHLLVGAHFPVRIALVFVEVEASVPRQ